MVSSSSHSRLGRFLLRVLAYNIECRGAFQTLGTFFFGLLTELNVTNFHRNRFLWLFDKSFSNFLSVPLDKTKVHVAHQPLRCKHFSLHPIIQCSACCKALFKLTMSVLGISRRLVLQYSCYLVRDVNQDVLKLAVERNKFFASDSFCEFILCRLFLVHGIKTTKTSLFIYTQFVTSLPAGIILYAIHCSCVVPEM